MLPITVLLPVGPNPANMRWLGECIDSVCRQTHELYELLIIDDSSDRGRDLRPVIAELAAGRCHWRVWKSPWNLGVAHAFNVGMGEALTDLVFMLGSDDTIEPDCIQRCAEAYLNCEDPYAYYFVGVRYMDTGETQTLACHAAMVTKPLWQRTGGFPLASASGAPDAAFISILMAHGAKAGNLRPVHDGLPLYNYRRHADTDTAGKGAWQRVILETRDLVTREWRPRDA